VTQTLPAVEAANGGFPEPASGPVRTVAASHDGCGEATQVRLPGSVPASAVRRLRCSGCDETYEAALVSDLGVEKPRGPWRVGARLPRPQVPSLPSVDFAEPAWRFASVPIAAIAVIVGLMLLQRGANERPADESATAEANAEAAAPRNVDAREAVGSGRAKLVRGSSFSLALPRGWERVKPQGGATFAAVSADGEADTTLWIERDPRLDLASFEARSLRQLEALAGSARVVERVPAPTPDATIVRLAADSPADQPEFEVTLRTSGPYRYYLATTVQPEPSPGALNGANLIHGSFTPEAPSRGRS
jgi:hypothetical protein